MERPEKINFNGSWIEIGKYEILSEEIPLFDENRMPIDIKTVGWINGAKVKTYAPIKNDLLNVNEGIRFTMPSDEDKLGDVFENLPWGLLKKNRTGIGATTLELSSPRNSIIVVPTRSLAYEKAKNSLIGDTNKYQYLYVGGLMEGFSVPNIDSYLSDNDITFKKFIVVVDSLPTLLSYIKEEDYKNYFIMFDEIDCYQSDSWYRPNMELAMDYYFKFPYRNRCLVSATIGEFTNPQIKDEPIINVEFNAPAPRNIVLQPTSDVIIRTVNKIKELYTQYPDDKSLIAFNRVTGGILPVLLSLPEEIQRECSVMCGSKSKKHVEEYLKEIVEDKLPSRITFITCTYFVGIDIKERFHLVSVADVNSPYTLLSTDKLQQIAGRCRDEKGLLSETIIYSVNAQNKKDIDYEQLAKMIINDAELLLSLNKYMEAIKYAFPGVIKKYNDIYVNEIVENSGKRYFDSSPVKLTRIKEGALAISFFNIDNILIQVRLLHTLYSSVSGLATQLLADGNNVKQLPFKQETEQIPDSVKTTISDLKSANDKGQLNDIIDELRNRHTIEDREILAMARRNNSTNTNGIFLDRFIEMQEYVDFEELVAILPEKDTKTEYKKFRNAVLFWALDENHPIRLSINNSFEKDKVYSGEEITLKVNAIWNAILGRGNLTPRQAVPLARTYFAELKQHSVRVSDKKSPVTHYKVISLNPLGLINAPIQTISPSTSLQRMIKM